MEYDSGWAMLVEPAATNLCLRSSEIDNASWTKTNATISANAITAPNGLLEADAILEDATAATHGISQAWSVVSGTAYTFSVYAKKGTRNWLQIHHQSSFPGDAYAYFDLDAGVVGTVGSGSTATIVSLGDGWYRCAVTATASSTGSGAHHIRVGEADNDTSYSGVASAVAVYLWNIQHESGSVATSPIPTFAATVTRAADNINVATSAFPYSATAGTLIATASKAELTINDYAASLNDGTANEFFGLRFAASSGTAVIIDGGAVQVNTASLGSLVAGTHHAIGMAWAANDVAAVMDGGTVITEGAATLPTVTKLVFGQTLTAPIAGFVTRHRRLVYLPRRMSDADLDLRTT
jgi:hypothetical protein